MKPQQDVPAAVFPDPPPEGVGLFDLDGTLVAWDCQLLFRHFVQRQAPWRRVFLPVFLAFTPFTNLLGAAVMKRVFLSYLWKTDRRTLEGWSREFARSLMPAIYPELRAKIERHREAGHFLILASASPEFYVAEIGRALGFDLSLGTPVEWNGFFPDLVNHKGAAKVVRLRETLPQSWFDGDKLRGGHGYTDSRADLPMLGLCRKVTVVNPSAALTLLAEDSGWEIVRPARPWKSPFGFVMRAVQLLLGVGRDPAGLGGRTG